MSLTEDVIESLSEHLATSLSIEKEEVENSLLEFIKLAKTKKTVASKKAPKVSTSSKAPKTAPSKKTALKKEVEVHKCEYVFGPRSAARKGEQCGKKATVEIGGKWYCGTKKTNDEGEVVYTMHAKSSYASSVTTKKRVVKKEKKTGLDAARERADNKSKRFIQEVLSKSATARKNQWGNLVHVATNMVLDEDTHMVLGVEDPKDGSIGPLTDKYIEICIQNGWDYDKKNVHVEKKEDDEEEDPLECNEIDLEELEEDDEEDE